MPLALLIAAAILTSQSLSAIDTKAAATYQDLLLADVRSGYFLTVLTLELGIPSAGQRSFEQESLIFPQPTSLLLNNLAINTVEQPATELLQAKWEGHKLTLQVNPYLKSQHIDYDSLLQSALTLIQQANNGQLPVINGRALKAALEQKSGFPVVIYERKMH